MLRPKGGCLSRTRLTSALFRAPRASLLLRSLPQSLPPETSLFFVAPPRHSAHRPRENIRVCANLSQPLVAIAGGGGVTLCNSMGTAWTADYLKITGELDVDLRSNIAAESRAKIVYERLLNFCDDAGTKDALQFLMTREITHMKAFMIALESLGKNPLSIGQIPPTPGVVDQFFNDSTGKGEHDAIDSRGPWNQGNGWQFVEAPAFQDLQKTLKTS